MDKIKCKICSAEKMQITYQHTRMHGLTLKEYQETYGETRSQISKNKRVSQLKSRKGEKRTISPEGLEVLRKSVRENCHPLVSESNRNRVWNEYPKDSKKRLSQIKIQQWADGVFDGVETYSRGKSQTIESRFGKIYCRSSWEVDFIKYCELSEDIQYLKSEPFTIKYFNSDSEEHGYRPDYIIEFNDGQKCLVEIKPDYDQKTDKFIFKHLAALDYCEKNNLTFIVLGDSWHANYSN